MIITKTKIQASARSDDVKESGEDPESTLSPVNETSTAAPAAAGKYT